MSVTMTKRGIGPKVTLYPAIVCAPLGALTCYYDPLDLVRIWD
ncbi:MAG TPA: hypothetical protein PLR71_06215 [Deltaproteobacteria bacterium]|nr:hypothetical protein [Deltaproteobacteria bacterium]